MVMSGVQAGRRRTKVRMPVCYRFVAAALVGVRCGPLAQLVERHVYTVDVIGSSPVGPTPQIPRNSAEVRSLGVR